MNNSQKPAILKRDILRSFNKAASTYDAAAFLQREVADRLLERLGYFSIKPQIILDIGAGTGYTTKLLERRYKNAKIIAFDIAAEMLRTSKKNKKWFDRKHYICGDAEKLPFGNQVADIIFSNLMLHWVGNTERVVKELQRVLKQDGLLLFTTLGPDTLFELRESWGACDNGVHVHPFIDMHHVGDFLLKAGFADPVIDMEFITITYNDIKQIFIDLKNLGTHNIARERRKGLTGKAKFNQFMSAYEKFRNAEGLIPMTYEVIYGIAWGRSNRQQQEISIPISGIKKRS
jgi:malonyl-CoA O-methyltransferase